MIHNSPDKSTLTLVINTLKSKSAGTLRANSGCAGPSISLTWKVDLLNDRVVPNKSNSYLLQMAAKLLCT